MAPQGVKLRSNLILTYFSKRFIDTSPRRDEKWVVPRVLSQTASFCLLIEVSNEHHAFLLGWRGKTNWAIEADNLT